MHTIEELNQEVSQLQQELQQKDLLVQQLSEELFRLVKGNAAFAPSQEASEQHQEEMRQLSQKLASADEQLVMSQMLLQERDREIVELRKSVEGLSDRTRMLEEVVQELPNVYRAKFAERMVPIKAKVEMLQKENRQLHIELQSLSYRLATRARPQRVELPQTQTGGPALPMFS
jgi:chromosome segregation ATPase